MPGDLALSHPLRAALIGFGAIGSEVYARAQNLTGLEISHVLVRPARVPKVQGKMHGATKAVSDVDHLTGDLDVVLEVAGHGALASHGVQVLDRGIDLCVASVGALADDVLRNRLLSSAAATGARLELLPGAIGGIDALAAARISDLSDVSYIGRKPPNAWVGTPAESAVDLAVLTTEAVVFEGSAREAAQRFPKNANVVATVALAGVGLDATRARLIADPNAAGNNHQIRARGPLVDLDFTTAGQPLPSNPRSSALTAFSALRALINRAGPLSL